MNNGEFEVTFRADAETLKKLLSVGVVPVPVSPAKPQTEGVEMSNAGCRPTWPNVSGRQRPSIGDGNAVQPTECESKRCPDPADRERIGSEPQDTPLPKAGKKAPGRPRLSQKDRRPRS